MSGGVREIQLTRGLVALVDADDFDMLSAVRWHAYPNNALDHHRPIKWYARNSARGTMHRALEAYYRQARNLDAERQAANVRLRAERRVGASLPFAEWGKDEITAQIQRFRK